ncbi:MAG: type I-U CRISPR-associated helicase/endonuclease Cas3 [Phycisphaerales bacterium JB039]
MPDLADFSATFEALTDHAPLPWQQRAYAQFATDQWQQVVALPTGLGKTALMAVWLIALASVGPRAPRRLVYIVNRRTIVDQATREAERLRDRLQREELRAVRQQLESLRGAGVDGPPLAISTLRGQFADNGEWAMDPARPAIIVGTVDMIGSRLLFSGYGRGFKSRPLHAAFLGQDALIMHDEAHLEPAFQALLEEIRAAQKQCDEFRPARILALTATPRDDDGDAFTLDAEDEAHPIVARRIDAAKALVLHPSAGENDLPSELAALATARAAAAPGSAILVFARTVNDVDAIASALPAESCEALTGALRGLERDRLVERPVFQRFLNSANRDPQCAVAEGTVFLVCTSAGEVGLDISADHLVCDLTPFESMAQRFGRVNRYGDGSASVDIAHPVAFGEKEYDQRCARTLELLGRLGGDASPRALAKLPAADRAAAFSPEPRILATTDILLDAWAMTSLCKPLTGLDAMPGRPPVADWLHGVSDWEPPEARLGWRSEVAWSDRIAAAPDELLEDWPLKPHELLRDRAGRIIDELKKMARRLDGEDPPVWIVDDRGAEQRSLGALLDGGEATIANRIVLLPPAAGGLRRGRLSGAAGFDDGEQYDVADEWYDDRDRTIRKRVRLWDEPPPPGMRLVRSVDFTAGPEEEQAGQADDEPCDGLPGRRWNWYTLPRAAEDDGSRSAAAAVTLDDHLADVVRHTRRLACALGLDGTPEGRALVSAAAWHDVGKRRQVWQRGIRNERYPAVALAKSGSRRPPLDLGRYRHEFGSLLDVLGTEMAGELGAMAPEEQDLALHLIAAHHGRARPHFPADEAFDAERDDGRAAEAARETPQRFARLQRRYGRWGLAYLESILRAADAAASACPSRTEAMT